MRQWAMKNQRKAFGKALQEIGREDPNVVALNADLSTSTQTSVFAKDFPDRFFNAGIAEANMIGMSAGLAVSGKIPFASTFAVFATGRAYDQIRQSIAYPKLNVKIVATHGGITVGEDGASHQMLEDIALMSALPNMTVLVPADYNEAYVAVRAAYAHRGPVYLRLGRLDTPEIYKEPPEFKIGRSDVLEDGRDVTLAAAGIMVSVALEARDLLREKGIDARVINCSSVKPLDRETLLKAARETAGLVVAEEHNTLLGLGAMVAALLAEHHPTQVRYVGINDTFGESGKAKELMVKYNLTPDAIAEKALDILKANKR